MEQIPKTLRQQTIYMLKAALDAAEKGEGEIVGSYNNLEMVWKFEGGEFCVNIMEI